MPGDGDKDEVLECLMCHEGVGRAEMTDHIASRHLNYELYKCDGCEFGNFDVGNAVLHARETRHRVVLNEGCYNEYYERLIKTIFDDFVAAASTRKKVETAKAPSESVLTLIQRIPPSSHLSHDGSSSLFSSSSSICPVAENREKILHPDQCRLCWAFVPDEEKRDHAWRKHLDVTVACPVTGCGYSVRAKYQWAHYPITRHIASKHGGLKSLSIDEKAAFRSAKKERGELAKSVFIDCFQETKTEWKRRIKKRKVITDHGCDSADAENEP